jgi:hypothetical protein
MDPTKHKSYEADSSQKATDELMTYLLAVKQESDDYRTVIENRAARNMRLVKGMPVEDKSDINNVTKRRKMYFRKIWSSGYRLLASSYQAFLQERSFRYTGRDTESDPAKAKVLQFVAEYRYDQMMRQQSLFVQFMWTFLDIIFCSIGVGKLCWKYNEDTGEDRPEFIAYPLEQIGMDWNAATPDKMRYCYFENYMTKEELEEYGYENISSAMPCVMSSSPLRAVRYNNSRDPMSKQESTQHYPEPGKSGATSSQNVLQRYKVVEFFYRKKNKIYMAVINPEGKVFFKKPIANPYGKIMPMLVGQMILEAHKPTGEGFPEPLEGPQESANYMINVRKTNVDLALRVRPVYDRDANVDVAALLNHKSGLPIGVDGNVENAVKFDRAPDVTQSSYMEVANDFSIMDEMSGVTDTKRGTLDNEKATVAQINQAEGNAKIDLFLATIGETFMKQFFYNLGCMISKFETDEKVFRVANEQLRKEDPKMMEGKENIYDLEDFDADVVVEVGASTTSKELKIRQGMLLLDRAIQSNNVVALMLKNGIQPQGEVSMFNISKFIADMAPDLGYKNVKDYQMPVAPPQQEGAAPGGDMNQQAEGQEAPQPNGAGQDNMSEVIGRMTGGAI